MDFTIQKNKVSTHILNGNYCSIGLLFWLLRLNCIVGSKLALWHLSLPLKMSYFREWSWLRKLNIKLLMLLAGNPWIVTWALTAVPWNSHAGLDEPHVQARKPIHKIVNGSERNSKVEELYQDIFTTVPAKSNEKLTSKCPYITCTAIAVLHHTQLFGQTCNRNAPAYLTDNAIVLLFAEKITYIATSGL